MGLGDPAQTGTAIGGICAASAFVPFGVNIDGDFENKNIAVEGEVHGKTYLLKLLLPPIKFLFRKPVFKLIIDLLFHNKRKGAKK